MISIKLNLKAVVLSVLIAVLMYPRTLEILIRSAEDISIARKLSSNAIRYNIDIIEPDKTKVVIMFDGGWSCVYTDAYEAMKKYNYKGTVAIIPSRINESQFMSYKQLADLYLEGWAFLNHSYSHKDNSYDMTDEMLKDFNRARQWMKNRYLGDFGDMVVMPYGEINPYLIEQLKAAGYRNVRTSDNVILLDKAEIEYYQVAMINLSKDLAVNEVQEMLTNITDETKAVIIVLNKIGSKEDSVDMTYSKVKFEEILRFINKNSDKLQIVTYSQLFE